jgi:hypothetical protein
VTANDIFRTNVFSQVPDFKAWFPEVDGFPRPDWEAIRAWIQENVAPDHLGNALQAITREWLDRMRQCLGEACAVDESPHFYLVAALEGQQRQSLLAFLEDARIQMLRRLGDISLPERDGKHVILRFDEENDYYRYISYFDPEGEYASSGGRFLRSGYLHIAYLHGEHQGADHVTLVHELTHDLLAGIPLPLWLNEALAMAFETDIAGRRIPLVTRELAAEHQAYWNAQTIQEFWRGLSFSKVDGQRLACSLARILLNLIATELRPSAAQFREFVLRADRKDAGQAAARASLDLDLSDLVATFLGPGDWAPKEIWKAVTDSSAATSRR